MRRALLAPALLGVALVATASARAAAAALAATPPMVIGTAPDPANVPLSVLPEGKGREAVIQQCALCHPIDLVVQQRRTQDEWDTLISRMADHGARANEAEQQAIFEYLVLHFGKEQGPAPAAP
jgi:hypothetical protein